jgi:hypothetical protein
MAGRANPLKVFLFCLKSLEESTLIFFLIYFGKSGKTDVNQKSGRPLSSNGKRPAFPKSPAPRRFRQACEKLGAHIAVRDVIPDRLLASFSARR